jgi:hypothetical protein
LRRFIVIDVYGVGISLMTILLNAMVAGATVDLAVDNVRFCRGFSAE